MSNEKKAMVKVSRPDLSPGVFCVYKDLANMIDGEFDGANLDNYIGDKIVIEVVEMTDTEFDNLGEFGGW